MCIDMKVSFIKEGLGAPLFYVIVTFFKTNFVEVSQKLCFQMSSSKVRVRQ